MNRSSPHRPNWRLLVPLLPGLVACGQEAVEAELLLPEEVTVGWDRAYNGRDDGLGALVPVDVMVYEGTTGNPLPGVVVAVWTDDVNAWPVPVDEVWLLPTDAQGSDGEGAEGAENEGAAGADLESEPVDGQAEQAEQVEETSLDHPGRVQAWDATRDQFVAFDPVDGIELVTDEGGVARLYVYVDAFPEARGESLDNGDFDPIRVFVSMGQGEGEPFLDEPFLLKAR
jgi:hypothetical protein